LRAHLPHISRAHEDYEVLGRGFFFDDFGDALERAKVTLPALIIDEETGYLFKRLVADIEQAGATFPDYLTRIGKSEEDIRRELRPNAEKSAKLQIILINIAKAEHLQPSPEEVDRLAAITLKRWPKTDPETAHLHAISILTNEAVYRFLESIGGAR
jgi:FKBP-type peptidyl-prolyl cis-trans isomerase (trigger factor)